MALMLVVNERVVYHKYGIDVGNGREGWFITIMTLILVIADKVCTTIMALVLVMNERVVYHNFDKHSLSQLWYSLYFIA